MLLVAGGAGAGYVYLTQGGMAEGTGQVAQGTPATPVGGDTPPARTPPQQPATQEPAPVQPAPAQTTPQVTQPPRREPVRQPVRREPDPVPAVPAVGYLTVDASPYGTVIIDGVEIGDTPKYQHTLSPGRHVIEIRREGYRTVVDTVLISRGNTTRLNKTLIPIP